MPPRSDSDSDWSDSDDEGDVKDVETSVLLGLPDGAIEKQEDVDDAAVSRMGGYPVRRFVLTTTTFVLTRILCNRFAFPYEHRTLFMNYRHS